MQKTSSLDECIRIIREYREKKEPLSLGYHGNVVDLWERLAEEAEKSERNGQKEILGTFIATSLVQSPFEIIIYFLVELGSDQTSCHNPFNGGYYPVQLTFEESNRMMVEDPPKFKYDRICLVVSFASVLFAFPIYLPE